VDAGSLCSGQRAENSVVKIQKIAEKFVKRLWRIFLVNFCSAGRFLAKRLEFYIIFKKIKKKFSYPRLSAKRQSFFALLLIYHSTICITATLRLFGLGTAEKSCRESAALNLLPQKSEPYRNHFRPFLPTPPPPS
jgi:hypothetical protein